MTTTTPARRPGRPSVDGPAPASTQIMDLARGLPLTRSVLAQTLQSSTASQRRFLADLLNAEHASRAAAKRQRLTKQAGFPTRKTLTGYDWSPIHWPPDWGRKNLEELTFIHHAEDLVLYGDVGTGKTHLAIAIGYAATQQSIPVRFYTAASLVAYLRDATNTGHLQRELDRLNHIELLIIDELGYLPIDTQGARLLFQVISRAYEKTSIIFTSNLEFSRWGEVFGDTQMAAAIIDRIVHHGRMLTFQGDSWRLTHATMK